MDTPIPACRLEMTTRAVSSARREQLQLSGRRWPRWRTCAVQLGRDRVGIGDGPNDAHGPAAPSRTESTPRRRYETLSRVTSSKTAAPAVGRGAARPAEAGDSGCPTAAVAVRERPFAAVPIASYATGVAQWHALLGWPLHRGDAIGLRRWYLFAGLALAARQPRLGWPRPGADHVGRDDLLDHVGRDETRAPTATCASWSATAKA
jgi:hypothetical protein